MAEANAGCPAKTGANICTGGNQVYHGENVQGCVDQLNGLTCAEVISNTDVKTSAPKCAEICITPTCPEKVIGFGNFAEMVVVSPNGKYLYWLT